MVNTMTDEIKVCLIGAGGIGSTLVHFLAPSLSKSKTKIDFHIFDSDVVEDRNIQFQQFSNSDIGLEDTSESFGLPATADLMFALISTEELEQAGQLMVKQLKNRYNDPTYNKRFVVGVDRAKMRLYDVDTNEQTLTDDTPVFDNSAMSERFKEFNI